MKSKFKMFQSVVATRNIGEPQLMGAWGRGKPGLIDGKACVVKGTYGAVVEIFEKFGDVGVEFFDDEGETIDVAFIPESHVRAATRAELEERRSAAAALHPDS